ncbi:Predicted ATPase [Anaerocolumna jejuensis DSM 15929]|uniref:Predicted ATPase n=1 Tax=Anaerocolumna jejuensis DSM 15929 TaxID=1121322 RepID=A0A1M6NUT6_9FIRM|nr:AAA family ATPase [Anaerocolumna jejuensis]SHJ99466.1 Predicted ATPase [Anaerocolumna jejuensis DSM 15929]
MKIIRYLSSFSLSQKRVNNPNIYPYNVFSNKSEKVFLFQPITLLYGNNASGKSTVLNIIANKLQIEGSEFATNNKYGITRYFSDFIQECDYELGEDEAGKQLEQIPLGSRYIKSEDILYEIKKIQQEQILRDGYVYEHVRRGMAKEQIHSLKASEKMYEQIEYLKFAQEKYSNGETTLQMLDDYIGTDALYLLDEPEVSLSPANQVLLAENINKMARFLGNQFIISTHSPFMLGTLNAKIYNLDSSEMETAKWTELENVRYFYDFFVKHRDEFEKYK